MSESTQGNRPAPLPPLALMEMSYGLISTQALYVAARLGLADLLAEGSKTADELAAATSSNPRFLNRILKFLVTKGVFSHNRDRFELNELGSMMRSDAPMSARPMAVYWGSAWNWNSWGSLLKAVMNGKTAFDLTHGASLFEYLDGHPQDAAVFNQYMAQMPGREESEIVRGYDFSQKRRLIDVGGGHGAFLIAALKANPQLQGALFDLPKVVSGAKAALAAASVADRCETIEGDFFESVPAGGDVYLISNILHDWDDERCVRILRNCRAAMSDSSALLVGEAILPDGNEPSLAWMVDLIMMALTGGQQRTVGEFSSLFDAAGLKLSSVIPTGGGALIEAVPARGRS
jgi:O-methyltransferase domain